MASGTLTQWLAEKKFVTAPGVFDGFSVLMANKIGFDFVYFSGFWSMGSYLAVPDAGIGTLTDMTNRVALVCERSNAAVIADADTGFGGLLNVMHTIRAYEKAGVTAIQLEDQEFPKKCGHTPGKRVIPAADMCDKIKVAVDARQSENFLVIARTDAGQSEGLQAAIDRAAAYFEAGADILFVESPMSEDEMAQVVQQLDAPLLINMANGGHTPIRTPEQCAALGFDMAIYPAVAALPAIQAIHQAYSALRETGDSTPSDLPHYDFETLLRDIGFEEVWALEKRFARD